jgi:L-amino acid N-acyltransferase YncA
MILLRRATEADAMDVWAWRQDPITRTMSRNQDDVPVAEHLAWFATALADPRRTLLIGEAEGVKVGMVRFDRGQITEVSINVNPAQRSQGHGRNLLSEAMTWVKGEVWAEIKEDNLTSRRLFEGVGFEFRHVRDGFRRYVRTG